MSILVLRRWFACLIAAGLLALAVSYSGIPHHEARYGDVYRIDMAGGILPH